MITLRKGDMFAEEVDALVNPVNCVGVMGAGVALEFKKRWPLYFRVYVDFCRQGHIRLGEVGWHRLQWPSGKDVLIFSFPTKNHWRDRSRIEDISTGLNSLGVKLRLMGGIKSIAIPALGCGLGGLVWNDVKGLIYQMQAMHEPHTDIRLYEPR